MIEEEHTLAGSIIGTGEDWITSFSTDELRDLFNLRGELIEVSDRVILLSKKFSPDGEAWD